MKTVLLYTGPTGIKKAIEGLGNFRVLTANSEEEAIMHIERGRRSLAAVALYNLPKFADEYIPAIKRHALGANFVVVNAIPGGVAAETKRGDRGVNIEDGNVDRLLQVLKEVLSV